MDTATSFGQWLRQRRKALGLTHATLGERVHCSVSALRKIEQDERRPSYRLAERLAACLQIPADERPRFFEIARGEERVERLVEVSPAALPPLPAAYTQPQAKAATHVSRRLHQLPIPPTLPISARVGYRAQDMVGREAEVQQIGSWLAKALSGERQLGFVSGEPGIGKTTLVDALLAQIEAGEAVLIGRGQCIEQYGAGEAYLPVLEALGRLCREGGGKRLIDVLDQYAPTWLAQLPSLLSAADLEALQRKLQGSTRERMLREMAEALEALTAEAPLVLLLEDLHWVDHSTLNLLNMLAQRRAPARLLILATYRPAEASLSGHPLSAVKRELQGRGLCEELALGLLTEAAVEEYLAARLGSGVNQGLQQTGLAKAIHQRTEGNPLFMVKVVDHWLNQGVLAQHDGQWQLMVTEQEAVKTVPDTLRQLIARQLERLTQDERQLLEAGSVAGAEFSAALVAAGLDEHAERVEQCCESLAQRGQFLRSRPPDTLPDGSLTGCYGFLHALYQDALYQQLAQPRRARLHRSIGAAEESARGAAAREHAAELAVHFERGQDYQRAVSYLRQAAENAMQRQAYQEAIAHFSRGLKLLERLPHEPERERHELLLQLGLGLALAVTQGYAAAAVEQRYARALALSRTAPDPGQRFTALWGVWTFYITRADYRKACELAQELLDLAASANDPLRALGAHLAAGAPRVLMGELLAAHAHLDKAMSLYDPTKQRDHASWYQNDHPMVASMAYATSALWLLGYPDRALALSRKMLAFARGLGHPFSVAYALDFTTHLHVFRREADEAAKSAATEIALAREHGFPFWEISGTLTQAWALSEQTTKQAAIEQINRALAAWRSTGSGIARAYFRSLLADVYARSGQPELGICAIAEAFAMVEENDERFCEAEQHRLKGELLLQVADQVTEPSGATPSKTSDADRESEALSSFQRAIAIARQQGAKSLELRAATSLSRLWKRKGRKPEARQMLTEICGWFTEGFDSIDLCEAKALLREL